jgi:hypothetical protein
MKTYLLIKIHAMKTYGGVEVYLRSFLTSTLDGGEWQASYTSPFTPGIHCIGCWVGSRAGLDAVAKIKIPFFLLPGIELRSSVL